MYIYIRKITNSAYFDPKKDIEYELGSNYGVFYMARFDKYCKMYKGKIIIDTNKLYSDTNEGHLNHDNLWYTFAIDSKTAYCMFPNSDGRKILDQLEDEKIFTEDEWIIKNIIE